MAAGEVKELPIILKADVSGSAEVLRDTLEKLSTDKVTIRVIHSGVGAINESDVQLAAASNAIIIGFSVRPERNAAAAAEQEKVDIRLHTIIYEVVDEMKKAMAGLLAPVFKEVYRGKAEIREVFRVSKVGTVAGCLVIDGQITRDSQMRIMRDNIVIHTGKIGSLRRFKDDVSEVRAGMECGITLENFSDVKQGDIIEAFVMQRVAERSGVMAAIGVLTLELRIEHAHSLKEKRHVVKSLKDRLAPQVQRFGGGDRRYGSAQQRGDGGGDVSRRAARSRKRYCRRWSARRRVCGSDADPGRDLEWL